MNAAVRIDDAGLLRYDLRDDAGTVVETGLVVGDGFRPWPDGSAAPRNECRRLSVTETLAALIEHGPQHGGAR